MAKKNKKTSSAPRKKISLTLSKQQKILLGSFLILLGVALILSFISFFFTGEADQTTIGLLTDRKLETQNWLSKFGAHVGDFFIRQGFGIAAFIPAFLILLTGIYFFFDYGKKPLAKFWFWGMLLMIWISVFFGFFNKGKSIASGTIGYEANIFSRDYIGLIGTALLLTFVLVVYLVVRLKITPELVINTFKVSKKQIADEFDTAKKEATEPQPEARIEEFVKDKSTIPLDVEVKKAEMEIPTPRTITEKIILKSDTEGEVEMEIEQAIEEEEIDTISEKLVKDFGEFDPRLELSNYRFPTLDLLRDHTSGGGITIDQEELEENKNRIVETLNNYKIGIANIKATVGPTVTLYEIVPEAGVRISKIKNLEDDIALSLSHRFRENH